MDKQKAFLELKQLENELVGAFKEFREVYLKVVDQNANLTNQKIYDLVNDEYNKYHIEVEDVKTKTLTLIKKIQGDIDSEKYQALLSKLEINKSNG